MSEANDRKIEDADPDTNVQGNELIPVSDDNLPKCLSVSQIKDFVLAKIAAISAASATDLSADGVYLIQNGALKPLNAQTLAAAILDYGFSLAPVAQATGNEVLSVKDAGTKKTITLSALQTWLGTNLNVAAMTQAGNLAANDLAVVSQASGVRKVTLGNFSAFVHAAFAAYVASLTAKNENLTGEELVYIVDANNVAKRTKVSALLTAIGGGDVRGPATTTEGNVPRWDTTQKKLTDGLPVATAIADTPDAANPRLPTEKAVKDKLDELSEAIDGKVDAEEGKGLSENDFTDEDKDKVDAALTSDDVSPETIADGVKIATIGGKDIKVPPSEVDDLTGSDIPVSDIDETTIAAKIASMDQSIENKVDAVSGKGLSTNDYTTAEKEKVASVVPVSASSAGLCPQLPGDVTKFLNGMGQWAVPSGGGTSGALTANDVVPVTGDATLTKKIATIGGKDIMAPQGGGGGSDVLYPRIEPVIVASDGETITLQNRKFNTVAIGEHENVTINVPEFSDEAPVDLILALYYEPREDYDQVGTIVSNGSYIDIRDVGDSGQNDSVPIGWIQERGAIRVFSEHSEEYEGDTYKQVIFTRYGGLGYNSVLRAVKQDLMPSSVSAPEPTNNYYPLGTIWIQGGSDPHIMLDASTNPMQTFGRWARLPTFVCSGNEPTDSSYAAMWFCTTSNKFYINLMYGRNTALSHDNVWKEVQFVN